MKPQIERVLLVVTFILILSSFALGKMPAGITGMAVADDQLAWDFAESGTLSEYIDIVWFSVGEGTMDMIVTFIVVYAVISLALALVGDFGASSYGGGEKETVKAAMQVLAVGMAISATYYVSVNNFKFTVFLAKYSLFFTFIIMAFLIGKTLIAFKNGKSLGWTLATGGLGLIIMGGAVVYFNGLNGIEWVGWLNIVVGVACLIFGIPKTFSEFISDIPKHLGGRPIVNHNQNLPTGNVTPAMPTNPTNPTNHANVGNTAHNAQQAARRAQQAAAAAAQQQIRARNGLNNINNGLNHAGRNINNAQNNNSSNPAVNPNVVQQAIQQLQQAQAQIANLNHIVDELIYDANESEVWHNVEVINLRKQYDDIRKEYEKEQSDKLKKFTRKSAGIIIKLVNILRRKASTLKDEKNKYNELKSINRTTINALINTIKKLRENSKVSSKDFEAIKKDLESAKECVRDITKSVKNIIDLDKTLIVNEELIKQREKNIERESKYEVKDQKGRTKHNKQDNISQKQLIAKLSELQKNVRDGLIGELNQLRNKKNKYYSFIVAAMRVNNLFGDKLTLMNERLKYNDYNTYIGIIETTLLRLKGQNKLINNLTDKDIKKYSSDPQLIVMYEKIINNELKQYLVYYLALLRKLAKSARKNHDVDNGMRIGGYDLDNGMRIGG
jgi:hypothetical protein